jgi:hypothetical protein
VMGIPCFRSTAYHAWGWCASATSDSSIANVRAIRMYLSQKGGKVRTSFQLGGDSTRHRSVCNRNREGVEGWLVHTKLGGATHKASRQVEPPLTIANTTTTTTTTTTSHTLA